jgi:hypothetical protein
LRRSGEARKQRACAPGKEHPHAKTRGGPTPAIDAIRTRDIGRTPDGDGDDATVEGRRPDSPVTQMFTEDRAEEELVAQPSATRLVQKEAEYFVGIECAREDADGPGYFGRSELANLELPCLHAVGG